jgi:hypothetical protein
MTTKTVAIIAVSVLLIILARLAYPRVTTFFAIDSCLDRGGSWNYQNQNCDMEPELKSSGSRVAAKQDIINFPCVVFVRPNSQKIKKLKKENSEDDYNTIVDDNVYYVATSRDYIDSIGMKRIERESEGSLVFKSTKGTLFKVGLDSLYWGVVLFNGKDKPIEADMTYINQDYESYMKK